MRFETTMSLSGNNTGIEVPPELIDDLGAGRKPPVIVTVNGYEYRSTVAVMGGRYLIPFSSDKRAATGIRGGDSIVVDLELDTAPRTSTCPRISQRHSMPRPVHVRPGNGLHRATRRRTSPRSSLPRQRRTGSVASRRRSRC